VFIALPFVAFGAPSEEDIGVVESFFQRILWGILTTITGTILWICAMLFDFSVNTFVIGFGNLFLGSGIGVAVDRIWYILRDFVNMFFIFGLVYIGFKMILDADNSNTRRWLVNLIIAAILINFSLFITKTVVDFSNNIATQIAASGFPGEWAENEWGRYYKVNLGDYSLGLMGVKDILNCQINANGCGGGWGYIFGTAIFFLITAFVLAAGAFLLMIRFIALTMFILVSPLMFVSWILPPISDTMSKYWHAFMSRAFFAPIYFLFIYFSFEVLVGLQETLDISSGGGKWAKTFSTAAADGKALDAAQSTLPYFFIMCGFMIGSLMIAQKLGADGANSAMSLGHSLKNKAISYTKKGAGAGTAGLAARAGRNIVGRGAHVLTQNEKFKSLAARSALGSAAYKAAQYGSKASFDARQIGGVGKTLGVGEGAKGGFKGRVDAAVKRDKERAKNMGTVDIKSGEGKARVEELEKQKKEAAQREKALAEGGKEGYNEAIRTGGAAYNDETKNRQTALAADEADFASKEAAGLLTDKDRSAYQARINAQREDIAKRQEAAEALKRTTEVKNRYIAAKNSQTSYFGTDEAEKTRLRNEAEKAKAAWDKQIENENNTFDQRAATATQADANARKEAEGIVKYSNQLAFVERRKRSRERWRSIPSLTASSTAGAVVGGLAAGAIGTGAIAGLSAAGSQSYVLGEVVKELEKEYGKDGVKKLDKEADEKTKGDLEAAVKKAVKEAKE
jgi:hypothetical protein